MRSEISGEIDHTVELISLVQVAQQLFPRAVRRWLALRIICSYNLNMIARKRLGAEVIVNICGVANNQHLHGAPPPLNSTFAIVKHAYCTLSTQAEAPLRLS